MPSGRAALTSDGKGCVAARTGPGSTGASGSEIVGSPMTTGLEHADANTTNVRAANVLCVMENMDSTFIELRVALDSRIGCSCRFNQDKPAK